LSQAGDNSADDRTGNMAALDALTIPKPKAGDVIALLR
jgi:hypothetical protein